MTDDQKAYELYASIFTEVDDSSPPFIRDMKRVAQMVLADDASEHVDVVAKICGYDQEEARNALATLIGQTMVESLKEGPAEAMAQLMLASLRLGYLKGLEAAPITGTGD